MSDTKLTTLDVETAGGLKVAGVAFSATPAELNVLDGSPTGAPVFTVGAEAGNVINVGIQLKDANAADTGMRTSVFAYLANDANGDAVVAAAPTGGVAIGTDGLLLPEGNGLTDVLLLHGNLAISGGDATQFKTVQIMAYLINGVSHTKAATDSLTFTAAHVITASKFGCVLVQIDAAGAISTKVAASPQAYDDAPAALAALPAADAGKIAIGYIAIENNAGDWTANTDDMTNASDVTTAAFNDTAETTITGAKCFRLISESDGDIDINITESGVKTMYLTLVLPSGKLATSGAIAFT